jgi:hypothetical protein
MYILGVGKKKKIFWQTNISVHIIRVVRETPGGWGEGFESGGENFRGAKEFPPCDVPNCTHKGFL